MSGMALRLEGVSKQYRLGELTSDRTLREALTSVVTAPVRRLRRRMAEPDAREPERHFWALNDVSFEVQQGEVLGLIGRNGAGKSTLLKILSRITEPTRGRIEGYGRVGSLLEVGTGFHPDLTGRENIFLNGAILGMRRVEIARKFDDIVEFSGVERFLDTPVKRYSSGMFVRLAYAVAAHLEPEILLVDEVLAVGDIDFQKKCIGSMKSVARSGRTVIVVSHNMAMIETLCERAIWMAEGRIRADGPTHAVITEYLTRTRALGGGSLVDHPRQRPPGPARFTSVAIADADGVPGHDIRMGGSIVVTMTIEAEQPIAQPWLAVEIRTSFDDLVFHCANRESGFELEPLSGTCVVTCRIDNLNLTPDRYYIDLNLSDMANTLYDEVAGATYFDVRIRDVLNTGMPMDQRFGRVYFPAEWKVSR